MFQKAENVLSKMNQTLAIAERRNIVGVLRGPAARVAAWAQTNFGDLKQVLIKSPCGELWASRRGDPPFTPKELNS